MKRLLSMLFVSILLFSCSKEDEQQSPGIEDGSNSIIKRMGIKLSNASLSVFEDHNITELGIYVYLNDSLVYGKNLPVNNGDLQIEVPLGENLKTFAVANAERIIDTDSLKKITIYQDSSGKKEVFVSDIASFISDKTVDAVALELKRMVGQAVFQPVESMDELSATTKFDALHVKFNNVVTGFMPGINKYIFSDITTTTTIADGYKASVSSFPSPEDNAGSIEVIYFKGGAEVNKTLRPLDVAIKYEKSKRIIVNMPVLNSNYLEKTLSTADQKTRRTDLGIILKEIQF